MSGRERKGGCMWYFVDFLSSWLDIFDQHANCNNVVNSLCYQTGEYLKKQSCFCFWCMIKRLKRVNTSNGSTCRDPTQAELAAFRQSVLVANFYLVSETSIITSDVCLNPILQPELHADLTDCCQSFQIMRSTVIRKQLFPLFLSRHTTTRLF